MYVKITFSRGERTARLVLLQLYVKTTFILTESCTTHRIEEQSSRVTFLPILCPRNGEKEKEQTLQSSQLLNASNEIFFIFDSNKENRKHTHAHTQKKNN